MAEKKPKPARKRLNLLMAVGFVQALYGEDLNGLRVACEAKMKELGLSPNLRRSVNASANQGAAGNGRAILHWIECLTTDNLDHKCEDANGLSGYTVGQALVALHATVVARAKATGLPDPVEEKEPTPPAEEPGEPSPAVTYVQKVEKKPGRQMASPEQKAPGRKQD